MWKNVKFPCTSLRHMHKLKWRWTIIMQTLWHFQILFCIMIGTIVKEYTHSLSLYIIIMLSYFWKYLHILLHTMTHSHNHIASCKHVCVIILTHLDISIILFTFTFHICTFVDKLEYYIHKYTQMHLIIQSMFATWSLIFIYFFCRCRRVHGEWRINPQR